MEKLKNENETDYTPTISVIIPVYNRARYVPSIIQHLLKQNYKDFETIFVANNNSTDDSIEIIQKEMTNLPHSKLVSHNENFTFGEARNIGVRNAKGKLIWFLDMDDEPLPDFLKCLTDIQDKYDADIVACNFVYSYSEKTKINFHEELKVDVMSRTEALVARSKEIIPVSAWSKIFKKDLIIDNDLKFISGLSEDIYFTYNAISCSKTICFYNRPLYMYRINPGSVTNDKKKE